MEQQALQLLKRKLDALSYMEPVDEHSAPLVQRLVDDLVHTTESYRGLKQQSLTHHHHISSLNDKVEVLQKDCSRLAGENNQLHLRLIKETEHSDRRERAHYTQLKAFEEQISQLSFWKQSTQQRVLGLEKENGGLKQRLQQFLTEDDSDDEARGATRLHLEAPLEPAAAAQLPRPAPGSPAGGGIDLLKAANTRVASLEAAMRSRDGQLAAAQAELQAMQEAVEKREVEIVRLGAEAATIRDVDVTALQYRSEAQENLILQLNEQLEARLREAVRDGNALARETGELKAALKRAQAQSGLPRRNGLTNGRSAGDKENLPETSRALALAEQRLSEAAAELQQRADALGRLEAERDEGNAQVERLKERLGEVEGAVAQLRTTGAAEAAGVPSPTVAAGGPPRAAAAEVAELRECLATAQADAAAAAAQRESVQHEATQLRSQVQFLEDEKAVLIEEAAVRARSADSAENSDTLLLRQRLLTAEADRDKLRAAVLQAQAQADELIAALKGLAADRDAARAAAANARSEADRLQTALAERPSPAAAPATPPAQAVESGDTAPEEKATQLATPNAFLKKHADEVMAQSQRLQAQLQELGTTRDNLAAELASKTEAAAVLEQEVAAAQERAEEATQRAAQAEAASAAAAGQLQSARQALALAEQKRDAALQTSQTLEADNRELRDELHAVSDDLEALVRENQVIGGQAISAATERDAWREEAGAAGTRAAAAEAAARAADAETVRLRKTYEALAAELRGAQGSAGALGRKLAARDGHAAGQAAELAAMREAHSKAQAQLNQTALDVQAWERQVAELSRQVSRAAADKDDAERERQSLLDALRNSEQARFEVERQREGAQRQMAAMEGTLRETGARCEEAEAQAEGLRRQLALEGTRVADLETLLTRLRASHFAAHNAARLPGPLPGGPPGPDPAAFSRHTPQISLFHHPLRYICSGFSCWLAERAAALEARLATAEAEADSARESLRQTRVDNATLQSALQAARAERNALNAAIRAANSGDAAAQNWAFGNVDASAGAAALAAARADLAASQEENGRLLDLVSKVDAERAALEKANAVLRAGRQPPRPPQSPSESSSFACSGSAAGTAFRGAPTDADVEAARLALELAHERAQREKAERDFEELLEGMQGGATTGRSGATSAPRITMSASPGSTSAEEQRRRLTQLQAAVRNLEADNKRLREGLSTSSRPVTDSALTSNGDSGATWRRQSRSSGPTGALAAYVAELSEPRTLAQQKVGGSGSQLNDCRNRKSPVSSSGAVRAFSTDRIPTFAAAPYLKLIKRQLQVESGTVAPALPSPSMPSPSFAARPVWEGRSIADTETSPQSRRQAAVRAKLARTPLYAYSQLESSRGVQKHSTRPLSSASSEPGKVGAKENEALKWFGRLDCSRGKSGRRLSLPAPVKPRGVRKSM
ncbi:hypothetical protein COCSUDRAFT_49237 [Coccomyxa subellipsoidea C-169]|uniref:Uncharacterized protein n=1 Tax=Coccomyxa subellipsoidea (strain C-169) TaxID=574566 RepID=I0YJE6_COCSC|nr:hypothetical protein COCSUDRAFT_49237 [Coccomyxa subellipsoidea C-169]EIE18515.1 hypothetical protein COCSUDRAFT_49237 [Coccomyxa subellipsoidea C-169]|eukprot:XP_005643059.1 hypothetical protein COCSUDRAFT_49237 [Coccomyxa subellipsoidea C-169]